MGVDFYAASHLRKIPIPESSRHTYRKIDITGDYLDMIETFREHDTGITLEDALQLRSITHNEKRIGDRIYRFVVINEKEANEWARGIEKEYKDRLFAIDWKQNVYYLTTENTEFGEIGRSYSGYSKFNHLMDKHSPLRHIIPSEGGIVISDTDFLRTILDDLKKAGLIFYKKYDISNYTYSPEHRYNYKWEYDFLEGLVNCLELSLMEGVFKVL